MIATEAKYVELCKYDVNYVELNFLQRSSAVTEGPRNACRSDLSVLEMRGLMVPLYSTIGSYWSNWCVRKWGVAPFAPNFAWKGSAPTVPTSFWRGQCERAELTSAVEPPDALMEATLPFSLLCQ